MIYHITSRAEWEASRSTGSYVAPSLTTEGFIHTSLDRQIPGVRQRFFAGQTDLVVLSIDPNLLHAELRYDPVDGDHFPHIYGPINHSAVVDVITLDA